MSNLNVTELVGNPHFRRSCSTPSLPGVLIFYVNLRELAYNSRKLSAFNSTQSVIVDNRSILTSASPVRVAQTQAPLNAEGNLTPCGIKPSAS